MYMYLNIIDQGSVVQSVVSLTSSSVVKLLTALVSTVSTSFLLKKKCEMQMHMHKLLTFFSAKI